MDDGALLAKASPGEEIVGALTALLNDLKIYAGSFSAIGACNEAELAHWDPVARVYNKHVFRGALEIVSLLGNVARTEDGRAFLHSHIVIGLDDLSTRGGHLFRAVASPTCEIVLRPCAGVVERALDDSCGLRLWKL